MKLATKLSLGLVLALAAPIAAGAAGDQPAGGASTERMQRWATEHKARMDARLEDTKDALKLRPEQYPLWEAFESSVREADKTLMDDTREMMQSRDKMSPPERLDMMSRHMAHRAASMKKVAEAAKPFYANLDDAQKQNFSARWVYQRGDAGGGWEPEYWQ